MSKKAPKSPNTMAGTGLQSVKKNTGKRKIHTPLGTHHVAKASRKSPFRTKTSGKRHKSK